MSGLKLSLNPQKTRIVNFASGFQFLGIRFKENLIEAVDESASPWLIPDALDYTAADRHERSELAKASVLGNDLRTQLQPLETLPVSRIASEAETDLHTQYPSADDSDVSRAIALGATDIELHVGHKPSGLRGLYVGGHGCWLRLVNERVEVSLDRKVMATVPLNHLDHILVTANSMISSALLHACADKGVQVLMSNRSDSVLSLEQGKFYPDDVIRSQLTFTGDPAFALMCARSMVKAKINNSKVLIRRFARRVNFP